VEKPNFLCVGAQKSGTTTLHDILRQHPDIYLPESKEAHFFDIEESYDRGMQWWLDTFFSDYQEEPVMGAITPEYLYYPEALERIRKDLGTDIKIVIMLRSPIERAYSHYLMSVRKGVETLAFADAVIVENERVLMNDFQRRVFSYFGRSYYADQVRRFIGAFGQDNLFVCIFESDFVLNRNETVKRMLEFLGVEQRELRVDISSNVGTAPTLKLISRISRQGGPISRLARRVLPFPAIRSRVHVAINRLNAMRGYSGLGPEEFLGLQRRYFMKDIKELEVLIRRDLRLWYELDASQ